ncbi:hypothetical protein [Arenibacter certesii]|uniref:Uncharacterized protein n=1 Tax=Arenibacter certesii TaxID=228955 RepID=A0A918IPL4_9FLAO|nr:hypothetical protein [Arenibacter certesii]GGW25641.1 hypothetical protein GCM10007383_07960 [Arenibacter certesii]
MGTKNKLGAIRVNLILSIIILIALVYFSFYGLYSDQLHFNKVESYILPILSLVHFVYIYILWFKVSENEYPDIIMRNIEYVMYGVFIFYLYEIIETALILNSYQQFEGHIIPSTFHPIGILIISLQILLSICTLWSFFLRKRKVGQYDFDYLNNHENTWG